MMCPLNFPLKSYGIKEGLAFFSGPIGKQTP